MNENLFVANFRNYQKAGKKENDRREDQVKIQHLGYCPICRIAEGS